MPGAEPERGLARSFRSEAELPRGDGLIAVAYVKDLQALVGESCDVVLHRERPQDETRLLRRATQGQARRVQVDELCVTLILSAGLSVLKRDQDEAEGA